MVVALVCLYPIKATAVGCTDVRNAVIAFSTIRDELDNAHVNAIAVKHAAHPALSAENKLAADAQYSRVYFSLERSRVILARARVDLRDANLAFSSSTKTGFFSLGPARAYADDPLAPAYAVAVATLHYLARGVSDLDRAMEAITAFQANPSPDFNVKVDTDVAVKTVDLYLANAPPMLHAAIMNLETYLEDQECDG